MTARLPFPPRRRWFVALAALSLVAGALYAAKSWADRRPLASNVVVVLVDTLRADHLSLYGYARETSPNLDRIARDRGVVFDNVRAQAPCTFPSVNSLMTSRSAVHFVRPESNDFSIPPEVPSVASMLRDRGFATAAVSASPIVRSTPSAENPSGGFGAGFGLFDESCYWSTAPCVTYRALELLEALEQPFFLYLHYMDPHDPYRLVRPEDYRFSGESPPGPDQEYLSAGDPNPFAARLYQSEGRHGLEPEELSFLVDRYDDEIRYWDRWFDALVTGIGRLGRLEDTVIVVVADHGEEFLEHGDLKHCRNLFDTSIRVPMVWIVPGISARRLTVPVTNLDLVPTVLSVVGIGSLPDALEGESLRPWFSSWNRGRRGSIQTSWWGDQRMVSDGTSKLLSRSPRERPALYRLDLDPGESVDRLDEERRTANRLRESLEEWRRSQPDRKSGADRILETELRSLGYLQ